MAVSIQRHVLDFDIIPLNNPKTLVFLDESEYMETPERPILQITPPGYTKYFTANIRHGQVNTLNSNTIGISKAFKKQDMVELPDGVWQFTYRICPYEALFVSKCHLRTVHLECLISKIYCKLAESDCDYKCDDKIKKKLIDILLLMETAKGLAEICEINKASEYYDRAYQKAAKLFNNLDCGC